MKKCDSLLLEHSKVIEETLDLLKSNDRTLVSSLLLTGLRHFVEHVMLKLYCDDKNIDVNDDWKNIEDAVTYVRSQPQYRFISSFHKAHLQKSVSHRIQGSNYSETLILMYLPQLIKIKQYLNNRFGMDTLKNLSNYPLDLDETFSNYYRAIREAVVNVNALAATEIDYYYVYKKKTIWIDNKIMYELTLGPVNDYADKFDRFLVFTTLDVFDNYAIEASITNQKVKYFDVDVGVKILLEYNVSIRTYELNNFAKIVNTSRKVNKKQPEFGFFMKYIRESTTSLDEIVEYEEAEFKSFSNEVRRVAGDETPILDMLSVARDIIMKNQTGSNTLKYLLCHMKNTTIKPQINDTENPGVSNLKLKNGTRVFDGTPFAGNLIRSKEPLSFIFDCIDSDTIDCQLISRYIKEKSDSTGQLYIKKEDVADQKDLGQLITKFNSIIPHFQTNRRIETFSKYVFISENETNTIAIMKYLLQYSQQGLSGYTNQANHWVTNNEGLIKGEEKKQTLLEMFKDSSVFALYGAAGTGKSTTISFVFKILGNVKKLCLASTHPAVENMRRKINDSSAEYYTISYFLSHEMIDREWDIIVIDECSVVSNLDMINLLNAVKFGTLLLAGDIYQLPSIDFGNWFHVVKSILPQYAWRELTEQFRTSDNNLCQLWDKVRNFDESIYEFLSHNSMTRVLDRTIFDFDENDDQVILCYNYDGLYGINSINRYLQEKNKETPISWKQYVFKVNDPVVFNNAKRFSGLIHNNTKGKILKIEKSDDKITFEIAIDSPLNEMNFRYYPSVSFVRSLKDGWTLIRFSVYDYKKQGDDFEPDEMYSIPFQISYAISIHKSQGLEYKTVKIVIANNVDELITHNVFYTAITRAKEQLIIYWTPETASKILCSFEPHFDTRDGNIIKTRMGAKC